MLIGLISCQSENCATKKQFLDSFDTFITEAEKNSENGTDVERLEYEDQFKEIINTCYKKHRDNLSLDERQEVWKKTVVYYFNRGGEISMDLKIGSENDEDFNDFIQTELEQVMEESGDAFNEFMKEVVEKNLFPALNEMFKGLEDLGKGLQELGQDLQEATEK